MATTRQIGASSVAATTRPVSRTGLLNNYFYFFMSLLVAGVLVYGFSHTINKNLFHPAVPPPAILYLHAIVFTGWLLFFIFQSALVRTHNVRLHRQTGWFGLALGVAVFLVGVSTAIVMARFHIRQGAADAEGFLIVPLFDMIAFSIPFALAIYWRKKPEFHRRLILIASCALTAAGFGRFPPYLIPPPFFYAGVDALILLGVARDLIVNRRIHAVYLYGLPAFVLGHVIVTYTLTHNSPWWLKIAHAIVS